jgi:hydrogenase nickel incorporation protein HypB
MEIKVMENILDKNDQIAVEVNQILSEQGIFTLNLMGSPGSGKTTLLENTIVGLKQDIRLAVIEGDLFTSKDAERIARHKIPVIQINTGGGCHLDANMVQKALEALELTDLDLIVIENVGNLVCPAEFNIGEDAKVTVLSVTEGDDKPLKYPLVFKQSSAALLNKIDLLPYTDFDLEVAVNDIMSINPLINLLQVSCRTGEGLDQWCDWLKLQIAMKKKQKKPMLENEDCQIE